ncbi:MAG: phosphoribosylanthranilate isomerase [Sediminibacterium sp.]|nr:phosphoribosylanthranilate isomerase [Sediminibacterium sp.]
MIRVKICCISSQKEAQLAITYGAAALGLVGNMPSGPGVISDSLIREIAGIIPPGIASFLLTSETTANKIVAHHQETLTSTIQLVDAVDTTTYTAIRKSIPNIKLVQVIHVLSEASIDEALQAAEGVDALLLDSGNPNLAIKELGGTGRIHNWDISKEIVRQSRVPVYLAGGIHSENIREAIDRVGPFGIDLCSGVRTNQQLDEEKLGNLFAAIK